jgi:hypothetical protein
MYRFLDKRFYLTPAFEIDLRDFACGHLGVSASPNVAELKRRVAPALAELEQVGFLEPASPGERYIKLKKGIWRIRFQRAGVQATSAARTLPGPAPVAPPMPQGEEAEAAREVVSAFYRGWSPAERFEPTAVEVAQAVEIVARHGAAGTLRLVASVIPLMRSKFPSAKRFGATLPYFEEAAQRARSGALQTARKAEADVARQRQELEEARRQAEDDAFVTTWSPVWDDLAESDREAIRAEVFRGQPYLDRPLMRASRLAQRFFLEALALRKERGEFGG